MSNVIIWIFQILLAMWFANAAYQKLTTPAAKMIENEELPFGGNPIPLKIIGSLELLGVLGIILPQALNVYSILTPVTAVCFSMVMIGASAFHIKEKRYETLPLLILAFVLSVIVACYRF